MKIAINQLSSDCCTEEYKMLQGIKNNENGFYNPVYEMSYEEYLLWLEKEADYSKGHNLPEGWIPQTTYFLYIDDKPVGIGRIDKMIEEKILNLIELISPHGRDYVSEGFKNKNVEIFYSIFTEENKGTFIKVENEDCCIFYAAFLNEDNIEDALKIIATKTKEYISEGTSKETCFNVYGNNKKGINLRFQTKKLSINSTLN